VRFRNVIVFLFGFALVGAGCAAFVILIGEIKHASERKLAAAQKADQIIDIWINRTQGSFFVFLPNNTARIYESYSFDLDYVGKWQRNHFHKFSSFSLKHGPRTRFRTGNRRTGSSSASGWNSTSSRDFLPIT
jgi:hypothetical protein